MSSFDSSYDGAANSGVKGGQAPFSLHPLHEAALKIAELGRRTGNSRKTKDLIGVLLAHGARAWRSSQPEAHIHLYVTAPDGRRPVSIRFGR